MVQALTKYDDFEKSLVGMEAKFKEALPKHIESAKFRNVVVTAVRNKPQLLEFDRQSLFNACMDCAQDGLLPNNIEAALVPFKGQVKYMPMVTGITKKARNSGEILTIDAAVVYQADTYEVWVDEKGPHFKHVKARQKDRGKVILTYAYAITKDGGVYHEEIDEEGMKEIEKCCKAKDTPWKGPFKDEMRRKSTLRRLCKYRLPSSTDMEGIIRRDDDMYDLDNSDESGTEGKAAPVKSSLEKAVDDQGGAVEDAEIVDKTPEAEPKKEEKTKSKKWQVEGKITNLTEKRGSTNGKPWIKYGCQIKDKWYGTFSDTIYGQMVDSQKHNSEVEIIFEEATVGERVLNNIIEFEEKWEEENTGKEDDKKEVPEDEIAI